MDFNTFKQTIPSSCDAHVYGTLRHVYSWLTKNCPNCSEPCNIKSVDLGYSGKQYTHTCNKCSYRFTFTPKEIADYEKYRDMKESADADANRGDARNAGIEY